VLGCDKTPIKEATIYNKGDNNSLTATSLASSGVYILHNHTSVQRVLSPNKNSECQGIGFLHV
jgi:hypothetical protein